MQNASPAMFLATAYDRVSEASLDQIITNLISECLTQTQFGRFMIYCMSAGTAYLRNMCHIAFTLGLFFTFCSFGMMNSVI